MFQVTDPSLEYRLNRLNQLEQLDLVARLFRRKLFEVTSEFISTKHNKQEI